MKDNATVSYDNAGQVDGQEAAPTQRGGQTERDESTRTGKERVEAGRIQFDPIDDLNRAPPDAKAHQGANAHLGREQSSELPSERISTTAAYTFRWETGQRHLGQLVVG